MLGGGRLDMGSDVQRTVLTEVALALGICSFSACVPLAPLDQRADAVDADETPPVDASLDLDSVSDTTEDSGEHRDDARVLLDSGDDAPLLRLDAVSVVDASSTSMDGAFMSDALPGPDAFALDALRTADAPDPPDAFRLPDAVVLTDASAGTCPEAPCRLVAPQCGCPTGRSCYPMGATRVCALSGTRPEGNGCAGISDCMAGLGCNDFSGDSTMPGNMCSRMCGTDADCAAGALCVHTVLDGAGGTVPGLRFCSRVCTPAPNAGCAPGLACTLQQEAAGAMRIYTDCAGPVGVGRQGTPCVDESDCAAGFGCFNAGFGNECLAWCRVSAPSCAGGTSCASVGIAGGVEWGACA